MKGGGDWEEYCPACCMPLGAGYGMSHDHDWMTEAYGYELSEEHRVFDLAGYTYVGSMEIYGMRNNTGNNRNRKQNEEDEENDNDDEEFQILYDYEGGLSDSYSGFAVHQECVKAIEKALGRRITYADVLAMRETRTDDTNGLCGSQFFDWDAAEETLPSWMFESPLVNAQSRQRILRRVPQVVWERSIPYARTAHRLLQKVPASIPNMAPRITGYLTGFKPAEYMPEVYQGNRGVSRRMPRRRMSRRRMSRRVSRRRRGTRRNRK